MTSPKEAHRLLLRSAALISTVYFSMPVTALSLGAEQVTSTLGQPLRMVVQLLGENAASLETRCFRVVPPAKSDGLYVVTQARIELQNSSTPPLLIVRGNQSIDEPIVRISIEAGCDAPIRREYTLLLDPPTLQAIDPRVSSARLSLSVTPAQSVAASSEPTAGSLGTASAASVAPVVPSSGNARAAQRAGNSNAAARQKSVAAVRIDKKTAASRRTDSPMPPAATAATRPALQDQLQVRASEPNSSARVDDASLAALAVPRLRVSSDLALIDPANAPGLAVTDELQAAINKDRRARLLAAPIDSDLAPRLEADLVVAQRRLAELQAQLAAAGIAVNAASKAPDGSAAVGGKTPVNPALGTASGWDWRSWLWIPGVLLIVALIAFLLRQRRGSTDSQFDAQLNDASAYVNDDEATATRAIIDEDSTASASGKSPLTRPTSPLPQANAANAANALGAATSTYEPAVQASTRKINPASPIIATKAEREASDRLNNPLFQLRDTESHVDVTVLSQVTEEAQVYAELGRNDQAIALLRDHIDGQRGDKSSPAPWLMIFELYRKTNDRRGYDELAPQFRKHFNGRVPDWDNYGHELALDDGLEAFPHLVARIERDWGTSDARKFLEELLYDNRGGSRLGFSLAAYRDILLLLQVHEGLAAEPELAASDWESRGANDSDGTPKWDLSLEMIEPPKHGELESFLNRPPPDRA